MDLKGQRFMIDLSDNEDERASASTIPTSALPSLPFVGDVQERATAPPSAPKLKTTTNGFPEHKKRTRISAFKAQRGGGTTGIVNTEPRNIVKPKLEPPEPVRVPARNQDAVDLDAEERRRIDEENRQRLESMSTTEIEEERAELFAGLNPSLIERLLKRANLDEGRGDTGTDIPAPATKQAEIKEANELLLEDITPAPKPVGKLVDAQKSVRFEDDEKSSEAPLSQPEADLNMAIVPDVHFPAAPQTKDLDPNDPSFLENLHKKYYPDLPNDPSKLAWMAPIPTHGSLADQESPYYPAHEHLPASALRFEFRGGLLPPRISRAVPSTKGLHHHGEAPEAAGYTVPELARLARSAFPAQRCIAFQTLGRLLYRLGRGEWGGADSEITKGLWKCVEEGKVIQTLEEAASAEGGHQGSKTYAIEALWLWQKGGGKVWKAS
ncbi:RPAP1-like protein [Amylocarpus encephaloides]|uniref:RPAP1-like protein n=1 Tax=Amylocarpus encephaloides TaxID=45428 RepID=A0A9P7YRL2_9HELO|nr:RPAP1-like protein [Amylocarpus encephaloides]